MVKICGVRDVGSAVHAAQSGTDLVGIICVPGTARFVSAANARDVTSAMRAFREHRDPAVQLSRPAVPISSESVLDTIEHLSRRTMALQAAARSARPLSVGVFMDQSRSDVLATANDALFDVIQLHGRESPDAFADFPLPIIKVLHVPVDASGPSSSSTKALANGLAAEIVAWGSVAAALLIDSTISGSSGGSGMVFDHAAAFADVEEALANLILGAEERVVSPTTTLPVLFAGGLTPENVTELVLKLAERPCTSCVTLRPCGVDVSSGVEVIGAPKGTKDLSRISAFVSSSKAASASLKIA